MTAQGMPPRQRGWLVPTLFTLCGLAILIGLGLWQLDRKVWKENLIATLTARLAAPPAAGVPPRAQWSSLDPAQMEYRRVTAPAQFLTGQDALVYTAGSALRPDVKGIGYWVFTPARLAGGDIVVVNRGFVPIERKDTAAYAAPPAGTVAIVGILRWPDQRSLFTPADEPHNNVWYIRDPIAIAAAKGWGDKGWGEVAPFVIDLEAPAAPGGLPSVGRLELHLPDNHLQYAVTWFGLAATLAGVYIALMLGRRRC